MRLLGWPSALGLLLAVGGCGKTAGKAGGELVEEHPAPVARVDLAPAFAQLQCAELADCCEQQNLQVDDGSCTAQVTDILKMIYASYAKTTTYDSAAAAECLQVWPTVTVCGQRSPEVEPPEVCQRVFVGHAKLGEPCNVVDDCVKLATGSVTCALGSVADDGALSGTCVASEPTPLVPIGSACTYSDVCAARGFCLQGKCHAPLAEGEACRNNETCATGTCVDGACGQFMPTAEQCTWGNP